MADTQAHDLPAPPPITAAALYGPSGRPHGSDIVQGGLGDCYLISTLGQYADRQPETIRNAIRYDDTKHAFSVSLHDGAGRKTTIAVTQDDLRTDRTYGREQAGGVDSPRYWGGTHIDGSSPPAWPAVMETAYAKLAAVSAKETTTADLDHIAHGGWPKDAIHALTGRSDTRELGPGQLRDPDKAYDLISNSIREGRPILLATNPMKDMPTDGLAKGVYLGERDPLNTGHAYMVEGVGKDRDGSVSLTLRNPWGHNRYSSQGVDSADPIVHVGLKTILDNGHLENVTIGPGLVQTRSAADTDRPEHVTRQNVEPGPQPSNAPARSHWTELAAKGAHASGPTPTADLARSHWADVAAKGAEARTSTEVAQTGLAGHDRLVASARRLWADVAAKGAETRTSTGAAQSDVAAPSQGRGRSP